MPQALQHQIEVFEKAEHHDIILDLAPTGTGKTVAGLTTLLHQPHRSAIYIAPTNALIEQQREAAEQFIQSSEGRLNHIVKAVSAKEVREWSNDRAGARSGEKLYNLIRNPASIFPEVGANRPLLLVTNPDIFYYATFFQYNKLDQGNIAYSFLTQFGTIIFDEFHLYDAKQLVGLLFYLVYLHEFGFFKQSVKVVLLTATPEPACDAALNMLAEQGVRIQRINGESGEQRIPSQTAVNLEIRPQQERDQLLAEIADEVVRRFRENPAQNGAVILDSKDHIGRLRDLLKKRGLAGQYGRITGSTPSGERRWAAQQPIILATSTVDVGFNFKRDLEPERQNLDWLIFSARDRAAFWQRLGRVGRVLGKKQTNIASEAIAYLKETAWEQDLASLDTTGGHDALQEKLGAIKCLERPFLHVYWQSEALLETARPLFFLEESLKKLPEESLILKLFTTLRTILGGGREWQHYRSRVQALILAEALQKAPVRTSNQRQWNLAKVWSTKPCSARYCFLRSFLEAKHPDDAEDLTSGQTTLRDWNEALANREDIAVEMKEFAEEWLSSYAPLFQFRSSLFENVHIRDPHNLLVDLAEETDLDPIHLLRNYEFVQKDDLLEVTNRAQATYEISFAWRYDGSADEFKATNLNRLIALKNCTIRRRQGGVTAPTPLLSALEKEWLAGVIVPTLTNQGIIFYLRKQGIESYNITVQCDDFAKEYTLFTGIYAIMTAAMNKIKIRLMDEEEFWIAG
ncbi:type I-D CRISPR-associated helicase Cas3' [Leptolyngbya sp. FACHB-261]|uniref:type I-D CRISPR-associated helicase Cas3' n=1 Tax=Leptolyngbya sp. FACHB-261 TaxID=2692806 RepID=UPI0018EFA581|nr:type I-D CRISPR-associated helicase Cas3' [Leptolyngbya sp. FACHB-261]